MILDFANLIILKIGAIFNVKTPIYEVIMLELSSIQSTFIGGKVELYINRYVILPNIEVSSAFGFQLMTI